MTSNREQAGREAVQRAPARTEQRDDLEQRRTQMHADEGHAGSVPRGNQQPEREILGSHRIEWERVLGH
jgi:hypothetical protein